VTRGEVRYYKFQRPDKRRPVRLTAASLSDRLLTAMIKMKKLR
jgi:hypothetical protein